jgi:hypothetical protein
MASAELLTTANTLGQGKWAVEGVGIQDSNYMNQSGYTLTTYGGYVGYGILDDLDAYLSYGLSSLGGLPAGVETTGSGGGLSLKYRFLKEGAAMPVSVAAAVQYKSLSVTTKTPLGDTTTPGSQATIGVGFSKVMAPFVPYLGLAYRTNASDGTEQYTQIDITLGTAIAWSMQGAVLIEYTNKSITDKNWGSGNHSSGQIAGGVAYKI